jgi:hypothetical protein
MMPNDDAENPETLDIGDLDAGTWFDFAVEQGWTDGMPVLPPTEAAVARLLDACRDDGGAFRPLPPRQVVPTLRSLAANAVMAGCRPAYFPVVLAAVRAMSMPAYNLHGTLATTHSCAPMVLVGGPIGRAIGINAGVNCFGQGWRANAAIGRAVGLIARNIGGAIPGAMDRATQGSPAKYAFCFGENEAECPWPSYRVRQGFAPDRSVATVMAAEPPHNINDHGSTGGTAILTTVASVMSQSGSNVCYGGPSFVVFGPEHAATLHRDRWTVEAIQHRLFETARIPVAQVSPENQASFAESGRFAQNGFYAVAPTPAHIHVVVAGGAGKHSAWIPSFGMTEAISVEVE